MVCMRSLAVGECTCMSQRFLPGEIGVFRANSGDIYLDRLRGHYQHHTAGSIGSSLRVSYSAAREAIRRAERRTEWHVDGSGLAVARQSSDEKYHGQIYWSCFLFRCTQTCRGCCCCHCCLHERTPSGNAIHDQDGILHFVPSVLSMQKGMRND